MKRAKDLDLMSHFLPSPFMISQNVNFMPLAWNLLFVLSFILCLRSQPATSQVPVAPLQEEPILSANQSEKSPEQLEQEDLKIELEKEKIQLEKEKLKIEEKRFQLEKEYDEHRRRWGISGILGTWTALISTVATIVGGLVVFFNYRVSVKNHKVSEDRQLTERFAEAINQLGTRSNDQVGNKIAIRLGGIYALERIAKDSRKDYWTIMEVLTEFIRADSPSSNLEETFDSSIDQTQKDLFPGIARDVQAALTVIGRRKKIKEPEKLDLSHSNLRDANLKNAKLSGANFESSKLSRAKLNGANLTNANLRWSSLNGADLRGTNLRGADLRGANLRRVKRDSSTKLDSPWDFVCRIVNVVEDGIVEKRWEEKILEDFKNKNLAEANLCGIYLHENNLDGANFSGANFSGATIEYVSVDKTDFSGANFSEAEIQSIFCHDDEVEFSETNFSKATIRDVDFGRANLTNADFCGATIEAGDLSRAILERTNFRGADLTNANLGGVNFHFEKVLIDKDTKLSDKWKLVVRLQKVDVWEKHDEAESENLQEVDLSGAYLRRVYLVGANLKGANLSRTNLSKADLSDADLSGADLSDADLRKARLERVDFRRTIINDQTKLNYTFRLVHRLVNEGGVDEDLSNTDLSNTDLCGVDLRNAILNGVRLRGTIINGKTKLNNKWRLVHKLVNEEAVNADLCGVDLSEAYLFGVDFTGANFEGTNLKGANLRSAIFWASNLESDELMQAKEKAKKMIQSAKNWEYAKYSPEITDLLESSTYL